MLIVRRTSCRSLVLLRIPLTLQKSMQPWEVRRVVLVYTYTRATVATIISANGSMTEIHADLHAKEVEKRKTWIVTSSSTEENNAVDLISCMMQLASQAWKTVCKTRQHTDARRHAFRVVVQILQRLPSSAPSFARSVALPKCTSRACSWAATCFSL